MSLFKFSGDPNTGHLKSGHNQNPYSSIGLGFLNLTSQLRQANVTAFCMQLRIGICLFYSVYTWKITFFPSLPPLPYTKVAPYLSPMLFSFLTVDDQVKDQVWGWKGDRDMRCMREEMASERPSLTQKTHTKENKEKVNMRCYHVVCYNYFVC